MLSIVNGVPASRNVLPTLPVSLPTEGLDEYSGTDYLVSVGRIIRAI